MNHLISSFNDRYFKFQDLLSSNILLELQPFKQENVKRDQDLLAVVLVRKNVDTESSDSDSEVSNENGLRNTNYNTEDSDTDDSNENVLRNTKVNRDEDSEETDSSRERTLKNKIQRSRKGTGFNETNVNTPTPIILRSSCNREKCERKCYKACRRAYKSVCNKYSCTSEVKHSFKNKCEDACYDEFNDDDYY